MDTIATMTSIALQYGVPLKTLVDKFSHTRFEPAGFTNNKEIPMAKSVTDYVFRYLGNRFFRDEVRVEDEQETEAEATGLAVIAGGSGSRGGSASTRAFVNQADAPACAECGSITVRNGACYKCPNCGESSGCS
jgi:ribonucleoside-diphosphate reductase alpha chain